MNKTKALEKLQSIEQQTLLDSFDQLSIEEQTQLLEQVHNLNIPTFRIQQEILKTPQALSKPPLEPFLDYDIKGNDDHISKGLQLISEGKVGCLLVAGGQGTRLKINGPKGKCPVSPIRNKSLFQLFAEKVSAAGKLAGRNLQLAVMTSLQNYEDTTLYFVEHDFFGLDPSQIDFFVQGELPLLNDQGGLFFDKKGHIAVGPDGNGSSLLNFYHSGVWDVWHDQGIRYVNYVLIDNPLADPFDAELIGYQSEKNADAIIKCIQRLHADEKVGVLVKENDKVKVIEYTEMPQEENVLLSEDGTFKHCCANVSLFSFTMDFIEKAAYTQLPLHLAHKTASYLENGKLIQPEQPNAWKFEKFIFDILTQTNNVRALLYPREECFAPLKNLEGTNTIEQVQKLIIARDQAIIHEITGETPPEGPIELAQDFYYPTEQIRKKWKGKKVSSGGYIVP